MSNQNSKGELAPEVISLFKHMEIKARTVVDGFMIGLNKSPYHGFSAEFSQHRSYNQGDSLKHIDWNLWAKSDKYFIKQYEEETNLFAHVLLDVSGSMNFKYEGAITKADYAKTLTAALLYLMQSQQDAVGLAFYSDRVEKYFPPKASKIYLKTLLTEIENLQHHNKTETSKALGTVATAIKKRGLVIIISDLFDKPESIIKSIKHFHYKKNEVIVFQILDPIEKSFAFGKDAIFEDMETKEKITTQPHQIQFAYQNQLKEFMKKIKAECLSMGVEFNLITTDMPFNKALTSFYNKRKKLY